MVPKSSVVLAVRLWWVRLTVMGIGVVRGIWVLACRDRCHLIYEGGDRANFAPRTL